MRISDWSSDVCSSDLALRDRARQGLDAVGRLELPRLVRKIIHGDRNAVARCGKALQAACRRCRKYGARFRPGRAIVHEIGRGSCRERGCQYGELSEVAVPYKKKK